MDREKQKITFTEIPSDYIHLSPEQKDEVCTKILEKILMKMNRYLPPYINKFEMIDQLLVESLISNEEEENYELCSVIRDILKKINES